MRACLFGLCLAILLSCSTSAAVLVYVPLDQQIDIGNGPAISGHSSFESDPAGGFVRRLLPVGNGAGGYYFGPTIDLLKAGYGPCVDVSDPGATVEYTARYFQGDGNTNPYADAPVFARLHDIDGHSVDLGASYGPRPDPTYPQWITVTGTINVPSGSEFDASKLVSVEFWGTDWSGAGNDFVEIKNLVIRDTAVYNSMPVGQIKFEEDNSEVEIEGTVTASISGAGCAYVEQDDRSSGIQVRGTGLPTAGARIWVRGEVQTDPVTREMYLQVLQWAPAGLSYLSPVALTASSIGGGTFGRQEGVFGGTGLNNTGLLVKLCGRVKERADDNSWLTVSDGSGAADTVRVDLSGLPFPTRPAVAEDARVVVTGISSTRAGGDSQIHSLIRLRSGGDYVDLDSDGNEPRTFRVLVVNFDPYCPGYDNLRTHEVFGWNDPNDIASGYIDDLWNCSGGWANYEIVDWFDADYHPYFEDGFRYDPDEYVYAWSNRDEVTLHPGTADYVRLVTDKTYAHNQPLSIAERIAEDMIDEVYFFGAPVGFAGWEAAMAGPSPFFVNGGTYVIPSTQRNFVMMGFNYERDVDCMLEDFLHRTECIMSRVYSPPDWWMPTWPATTNWDKFRMLDIVEPGKSACGNCHFAPNSDSDYDWGNTRYVWSTCDDWLYNWPDLAGDIMLRFVNCEEWGNGDMRAHHLWWLEHLPKAPGVNADGMLNNWWKYSCDFNNHPESR